MEIAISRYLFRISNALQLFIIHFAGFHPVLIESKRRQRCVLRHFLDELNQILGIFPLIALEALYMLEVRYELFGVLSDHVHRHKTFFL